MDIRGALSLEIKRLGREAEPAPEYIVPFQIKNEGAIPPLPYTS
jgi:hypothetical protein